MVVLALSALYGGCMLSLCLPVSPRTPASKDMQLVGLSGDSNLPIGVSVNSCLFLCVSHATHWRPVQGPPCLSPYCVWDRLLPIFLLEHPPSLCLYPLSRWQESFIKNVLVYFSVYPSFSYLKCARTACWKTAPHHDVPTSKLRAFWTWCVLRHQLWSHLTRANSVFYRLR